MGELVRKQLYIYRTQDALLKRRAKELGISEAELVRRAISEQMMMYAPLKGTDAKGWEKEKAFITQWMAMGPVKGGRTWKREELHER